MRVQISLPPHSPRGNFAHMSATSVSVSGRQARRGPRDSGRGAGPGLERGFTIVELLIVIVVIAILAAISIVAYNGIQDRAREASAVSAARNVATQIQLYETENGTYPTDLDDVDITDTGSTTYNYRSSSTAWCATITVGNKSSWVSNERQTPQEGACAGMGAGGQQVMTNLHQNPSLKTSASGYSAANNATIERRSESAIHGNYGLRVITNAGGNQDSGVNIGIPSPVSAGEPITYSISIRAVTAGTYRISFQSTAGGQQTKSIGLAAGQVGRLTYTHTPTTSGSIVAYILRTTTSAATFDIDGIMVTKGAEVPSYADGDSPGWIWNGTPHVSTSTGPAL